MCILNMNLPKFIRGYSGHIKSISPAISPEF
jgi:hypothetical protein